MQKIDWYIPKYEIPVDDKFKSIRAFIECSQYLHRLTITVQDESGSGWKTSAIDALHVCLTMSWLMSIVSGCQAHISEDVLQMQSRCLVRDSYPFSGRLKGYVRMRKWYCPQYVTCAKIRSEYEVDVESEIQLWKERFAQLHLMGSFQTWLSDTMRKH